MKKITKVAPPDDLKRWKQDNAQAPQNLRYGLAKFPHDEVLKALLREQGHICAYTLKRICPKSAHIEHLKAQTICKEEDRQRELSNQPVIREDIAWNNIVACFPEPKPPAAPEYGAVKKGGWWNAIDFVSPLEQNCEQRFRYTADGSIAPANREDSAAAETIKRIGLDNVKLGELRRAAFLRAGIHKRANKPIRSAQKVEQLIAQWANRHIPTDSFAEFCIPLLQVAKDYAQFLRDRGLNGE